MQSDITYEKKIIDPEKHLELLSYLSEIEIPNKVKIILVIKNKRVFFISLNFYMFN